MPNFVLLTGAGFSKNWGGFVAREITNALMSQLQNNPYLLQALRSAVRSWSMVNPYPVHVKFQLAKGFALDIPWSWRLREGGE